MQSYDRLTAAFPSEGTNHVVAVRAEPNQAARVSEELTELSSRTQNNPLFANVTAPVVKVSRDQRVTTLEIPTPHAAGTEDGDRSLAELRTTLVPATVGTVTGAEYAVGGDIAGSEDYAQNLADRMPIVIGFVLLLTFLIMAVTFRSLVVAATALLLNSLSAAAAFGTLTLVFQHSWAEGILDFQSNGSLVAWIPLFLFVVLFGLSMDYHVFVVSRVREAAVGGMSTRDAVAHGISRSAGVVTSAAVLMVSVFAIFATLSMNEMKQMGVGLAVAVFIDAMIVRVLVLPSAMALLGTANWWPGRIRNDAPSSDTPIGDRPTEQLPTVVMHAAD
jgi:RND superfamily putative drug exporter